MASKNVIVTGIGGNVGQGIIRNIISLNLDIKIIGLNVTDFSAGNYLCDYFYKVPYAYDMHFIETLLDICKKHQVDLIIPSTDYEVYYLSKNKKLFNCEIAVSDETAAFIYLDKYETWKHHQKNDIPFADSTLPSLYENQFQNIIVKPKKGRGSRGLHINPENVKSFSDEEYMVQEMHKGDEITTAIYVTKKRELHGMITMSRTLENGATNSCKVIFEHNYKLLPIVEQIIQTTPVYGSFNVQSIVTDNGSIIPFEVNCRISGTNSIRSNFGFKDVAYTIQEYLFHSEPEKPEIIGGVAVRVLLDVIYPNQNNFENIDTNQANHFIF